MDNSGGRPTKSYDLTLDYIAKFYDYSGDTSCIDPATLRDYNMRIKSSTDDNDRKRKRSIDDLPNELLIAIIQDVVADASRPSSQTPLIQGVVADASRPSCQTQLILSLVDHRWADLIVQTPSFWTTIDLMSNTEDLEVMIALQLKLSGNHSLVLVYCIGSDIIHRTAHLIQPHLHRVAHLYLQFDHNAGTDPFFPRTIFVSLRDISIATVYLEGIAEILSRHEAFAPYTDLMANSQFNIALKVASKDLVSIDFCSASAVAIQCVENITTLKQVSINRNYIPSGSGSIILEERDTPLSWEVLDVGYLPWRVTHGLLSRCVSLTSLTLEFDGSDPTALLNVIPRLVSLECVDIRLSAAIVQDTAAVAIDSNPRIRTMAVVLMWDNPITNVTTNFVHLLLRMSPRIESFAFSGFRGRNLNFREIDKLNYLRELTLGLQRPTLEPNETRARHILASPSLEVVHIKGSSLVLDSLGSLTASRLSYVTDNWPEPTSETIWVSSRDWPSLETLDMRMNPEFWSLQIMHRISVMSLRRLCLSNRLMVTKIIHHLAMHSSELPLLDTLELGSCPEWDILFIMLEKRLLGQTTGIKPVETILFSRMIPTRTKHALALLLAGHIASRPSNYELSMQGNLDIFLDVDIPGCVECHLYLRSCDIPTNHTSPNCPLPLATYPSTASEILSTHSTRYEQTESIYSPTLESERDHRRMNCMWWSTASTETVEISRYSID